MSMGVGTALSVLLEALDIHPNNCECREKAKEMDEEGIETTKRRKQEHIQWLRAQQIKFGWIKTLNAARKGLTNPTGRSILSRIARDLNLTDFAPSLINMAIELAEESNLPPA